MDHADDVVGIVAIDGQAGVVGLQALIEDRLWVVFGVDHLDLAAVEHDFLDRAFAEIERAEDAVTVLFFDHAFGMAQIKGTGDFLAHGQDLAVGVGLHAEDAQHPAHQQAPQRR